MESQSLRAKAIPYRPRRSMLNWADFLVILATVMVFGAVVATSNPHARAQSRQDSPVITELPEQASVATDAVATGLIKAKIRLAAGAPWK